MHSSRCVKLQVPLHARTPGSGISNDKDTVVGHNAYLWRWCSGQIMLQSNSHQAQDNWEAALQSKDRAIQQLEGALKSKEKALTALSERERMWQTPRSKLARSSLSMSTR
jgi:ferric-dicitrate binding protein FerR (iron transport regulator)